MKWTISPADPVGKIQAKRFEEAWRAMGREHNTFIEQWGVRGGEEHSSTIWSPFSANVREDVVAAQKAVGDAYAWTLTRATVNAIIDAMEAALPALKAARPVIDKRRTAGLNG